MPAVQTIPTPLSDRSFNHPLTFFTATFRGDTGEGSILVNAAFLVLALVFIIALIGVIRRIRNSDQLHIGHP
jgi:hypothetical protein